MCLLLDTQNTKSVNVSAPDGITSLARLDVRWNFLTPTKPAIVIILPVASNVADKPTACASRVSPLIKFESEYTASIFIM